MAPEHLNDHGWYDWDECDKEELNFLTLDQTSKKQGPSSTICLQI